MKLIARVLALVLVARRMKARRGEPPAEAPSRPAPAAPDTPAELEPSDWKVTAKRALKEVKDDRATLVAAGMAYYFFLAIFPAVIAVIGILDLTGTSTDTLVDTVRSALPGGTGQVVVDAVQGRDPAQGASLTAAIVGVALALWSASSGMVALQSGLNVAYDIGEDRKFVGKRLVAFALLVAAGLLGGVPTPFIAGEGAVAVTGWIVTIPAVIVLFAFLYYIGPKRESPKWVWVTPGGLVGAILWLVVSGAFGFYVNEFASYGKTYGSLAGVIVLIFWLYLSALTIMVGAELNAESERRAEQRGGQTKPL
ncbi:MAG: YihY/virulence factor BrkB family protein [Actinomycetota bacterium]|nr:YihY/virulence factor BrkB family protein [Actinomycetota bacterium]